MLKQILVPLDGTPRAETALPLAEQLARATGGALVLVRAIRGVAEAEVGILSPEGWVPAADPRERDEASAYLQAIATREPLRDIPVRTVVGTGPAAPAILKAARANQANLVVMTSRERSGLARWLLGSVARQVLRETDAPVLVLRATGAEGTPATASPKERSRSWRAVVALDGSPLAEAALGPAVELVSALSAPNPPRVDLVRVVELVPTLTAPPALGAPVGYGLTDQLYTEAMREARGYLSAIAERVRQQAAAAKLVPVAAVESVTETAVLAADVPGTIAALADRDAAAPSEADGAVSELIAVATRGHSGLKRLVLGSVTERLLDSTARPVLVVPPSSPEAADG